MKTQFIWRDNIDPNWFSLGVKLSDGKHAEGTRVWCDAISDLFGDDAYRRALEMTPGEIRTVKLTMEFFDAT